MSADPWTLSFRSHSYRESSTSQVITLCSGPTFILPTFHKKEISSLPRFPKVSGGGEEGRSSFYNFICWNPSSSFHLDHCYFRRNESNSMSVCWSPSWDRIMIMTNGSLLLMNIVISKIIYACPIKPMEWITISLLSYRWGKEGDLLKATWYENQVCQTPNPTTLWALGRRERRKGARRLRVGSWHRNLGLWTATASRSRGLVLAICMFPENGTCRVK